jgi:hypothetical protein
MLIYVKAAYTVFFATVAAFCVYTVSKYRKFNRLVKKTNENNQKVEK